VAYITVNRQFTMPEPPAEALQAWQAKYSSWLAGAQFQQTGQSPQILTYTRRYIPWWTILLAVILFPIGLLFLLIRNQNILTLSFVAEAGGSRVTIAGTAKDELHKHLMQVADQWDEMPVPERPRLPEATEAAPRTSSTPDYLDQLGKLTELRDAGALSPEEFEAEKARILGR
jgi:hypothetical protein